MRREAEEGEETFRGVVLGRMSEQTIQSFRQSLNRTDRSDRALILLSPSINCDSLQVWYLVHRLVQRSLLKKGFLFMELV